MSQPVSPLPLRRNRGFTLIELMIAVVVIAIIAAIAIPSFIDSVRKSRRSDAFAALSTVQQAQERWRSNNASYAPLATSGTPPNGLGLSTTSPSAYYGISLSDVGATGYTALAVAASDKSQASDAGCQVMAVRMTGGNLVYGSSATISGLDFTADNPDAQRCWAR